MRLRELNLRGEIAVERDPANLHQETAAAHQVGHYEKLSGKIEYSAHLLLFFRSQARESGTAATVSDMLSNWVFKSGDLDNVRDEEDGWWQKYSIYDLDRYKTRIEIYL